MKRLARIVLKILPHLSLILCLASAAVWVRGYWIEDNIRWARPDPHLAQTPFCDLQSGGGGVAVTLGNAPSATQLPVRHWHWRARERRPRSYAGGGLFATRWGFAYHTSANPNLRFRRVYFPAWLPAALFAVLPLARLASALRRRLRVRFRPGHCTQCGYDLRATPHRCPECGTTTASSPQMEPDQQR